VKTPLTDAKKLANTQCKQVVNLLRQVEGAVANGKTTDQACLEAGIVEQKYLRWQGMRRSASGPGEAAEKIGTREHEADLALSRFNCR
jgi:hypothetical protein